MNPPAATRSPADVASVRSYWDSRPLGTQYVADPSVEVGSAEYFAHIRPWMNPFKFPWIMERIEREASILAGRHLLELGCGMGFDSVELLKRGVRVTATDLSPRAVALARRHFELESLTPEAVRIENAFDLTFGDEVFDAVWANGVIHETGDPDRAMMEVYRVLKPGGRAIISHFYRRPSWMHVLFLLGETIENPDQDPPVRAFLTEREIEHLFRRFDIESTAREHERALPIFRKGPKAVLYTRIFKPLYNLLPRRVAESLAYKYSVTAVKPA